MKAYISRATSLIHSYEAARQIGSIDGNAQGPCPEIVVLNVDYVRRSRLPHRGLSVNCKCEIDKWSGNLEYEPATMRR